LVDDPPPSSAGAPPTLTSITAEQRLLDEPRLQLPRLYPQEDRSSDPDERLALVDLEKSDPSRVSALPPRSGKTALVMLLAVGVLGGALGTAVWLVKSGTVRLRGTDPPAAATSPEAPGIATVAVPPSTAAAPIATPASAWVEPSAAPSTSSSAVPEAPPVGAPPRHLCAPGTKASAECSHGLSAWCDRDEKKIACCDVGLVPSGSADACGCPLGGPLMPKAIAAGCSLPADSKPLSLVAIQDVIRAKQADFRGCYKALPPDPKRPFANVVVGIELAPDGRVFSARIEGSNAPDKAAEACVLGVADALRFPPPAARGMRFLHPLTIPVGN
jgi:hypothetical protein